MASINPDAMRLTMELSSDRPERIELTVTDSLFVLSGFRGGLMELPMGGDEVPVPGFGRSEQPVTAKLRWDGRIPRMERSVDEGGDVVDRLELVGPDRLLVTRSYALGPRGDVEVRLVFDRKREGADAAR